MELSTSSEQIQQKNAPCEQWLRKRKLTTIVFALQNVIDGWEFSLTLNTLWLYLHTLVKPGNEKLAFALVSVGYSLSAFIFSPIVCKIADKTRNVKRIVLIVNTVAIIGNIIYTIHFSVWYLLAGRLVVGLLGSLKSVIVGELSRSYCRAELGKKVSMMSMSYLFGFVIGSLIVNLIFIFNVTFTIGKVVFTFVNISALCLIGAIIILQAIGIVFLHNLSKEYDLKAACEESPLLLKPISLEDAEVLEDSSNSFWYMRQMVTNSGTNISFALCFFETFIKFTFISWEPMLVVNVIRWSISVFNWVFLAQAISIAIPCVLFTICKFSDRFLTNVAIISLLMTALDQLAYIFSFKYHTNFTVKVCLTVARCLLISTAVFIKDIFATLMLAKMVSSKYQSFTDSFRTSLSRLAEIVAFFSAVYSVSVIEITGYIYLSLSMILFFCLIGYKKRFIHPELIV